MQPLIEPLELKGILTLSFCHWMTSLRMVGRENRQLPGSLEQLPRDEISVIRVCPCCEEKRNSHGIQNFFCPVSKPYIPAAFIIPSSLRHQIQTDDVTPNKQL